MATVGDLIKRSLQHLGVNAVGETLNADDANFCLTMLNNMLANWSTQSLAIYVIKPHVFPFIPGQGAYTLGPSGNFNMARPVRIEDVTIRDNNQNDYPCAVVNFEKYSQVVAKQVESSLPFIAWDDGGFPLKTLTFWPVPGDSNYSAVLWTWDSITGFTTLTDVISLPPGYEIAMEFNLAVICAPAFGREAGPTVQSAANETFAQLKRINAQNMVKEMFMPNGMAESPKGWPSAILDSGLF